MKYLGVLVDEKWDLREHLNYAAEKGMTSIKRLGRIMPNTGGPKENKRRLYSSVIHPILLYAPVWAEEMRVKKAKKELTKLQNVQKQVCIRMISAYKTVSYISALLMARILPIEYQADMLRKLYLKTKEMIETSTLDTLQLHRHYKNLTEKSIFKWRIKLNKPSLPDKRVRSALLPQLSAWFNIKRVLRLGLRK